MEKLVSLGASDVSIASCIIAADAAVKQQCKLDKYVWREVSSGRHSLLTGNCIHEGHLCYSCHQGVRHADYDNHNTCTHEPEQRNHMGTEKMEKIK